jgi:tetratricopeptide (TPR) repeat protein
MRLRRGDSPSAISAFERALSVAAFADSPVGVAYVSFHLGYALALSGRLDEGVRMLEATVALAETKGFVARHALRLAYLAETYALAGRLDEAVSIAGRAVRVAREHDERANEAYALRVHGEVAFRRGELADAQPALLAAVQLAQKLEIRPLLAHCHRALARAYQADGDEAQAVLHARAAGELVEAMGMRFSTPELEPPVRAGRADGDTTAEHEPARPRRSGHARRTG